MKLVKQNNIRNIKVRHFLIEIDSFYNKKSNNLFNCEIIIDSIFRKVSNIFEKMES